MQNLDDTFGEWGTDDRSPHSGGGGVEGFGGGLGGGGGNSLLQSTGDLMSYGNNFKGLSSVTSVSSRDCGEMDILAGEQGGRQLPPAPPNVAQLRRSSGHGGGLVLPTGGAPAASMRSSVQMEAIRRSNCNSVDLEHTNGGNVQEEDEQHENNNGKVTSSTTAGGVHLAAEQGALHENGVLDAAVEHSKTAFTSCDIPLCTPHTACFTITPTMSTYRGTANITPKGKIQHPVDHPSNDYLHYILPPAFPPELDGRVGTLRFFSIYADLPPEEIATKLGEDCQVKIKPHSSKSSVEKGAVVCKVERTVFHPVTQGCMKRTGMVVQRNTMSRGAEDYESGGGRGGPGLSAADAKYWALWWGARFKEEKQFQALLPFQKVNHFPRTWLLGRKDHLARGIQKAAKRVHRTEHQGAFSFVPQTYSLPIELSILKNDVKSSGTVYICKPPASAQGKGIFLFSDRVPSELTEVREKKEKPKKKAPRKLRPRDVQAGALGKNKNVVNYSDSDGYSQTSSSDDSDSDSNSDSDGDEDEPCIVQRYLTNPFLINGFKCDLRIYVLCTSYEPLTVYVFNDGLVRFATQKYDLSDIDKIYSHLTNYSLNKKNTEAYSKADDDGSGSKWTLHALKRFIIEQMPNGGYDVWDKCWNQVHDVIIKTLISAECSIAPEVSSLAKHAKSCHEMYGFDIMLTDTLEPILIEVNVLPSLACAAALDKHVKGHMIADMLTLVGIPCQTPASAGGTNGTVGSVPVRTSGATVVAPSAAGPLGGKENLPPSAGPSAATVAGGNNIRIKSTKNSTEVLKALKDSKAFIPEFFNGKLITEDDKALLRECEEEFRRNGGFTRVFPTPDSASKFGPLFEKDKRLNWISWRWEEEKRRFSTAEREQAFQWLCGKAPYPAGAPPVAPKKTSSGRVPSAAAGSLRARSNSVKATSRVSAEPKHVAQRVRRPPSPPKASLRTTTFQFVDVPPRHPQ